MQEGQPRGSGDWGLAAGVPRAGVPRGGVPRGGVPRGGVPRGGVPIGQATGVQWQRSVAADSAAPHQGGERLQPSAPLVRPPCDLQLAGSSA
eukprot:106935-Chlamydomonas_euryale.AAC.2